MNRAFRLALLALAGLTARAAAQMPTPFEPQLIFSIGGGMAAGSGELWSLPQQGVLVVGSPGNAIDTVGLARYLVPGPVATLAATYHHSPNLGLMAEGGYFGIASEQRCTAPPNGYQPDPEDKNEQACTRGNGSHVPTSMVGFQVGLVYRMGGVRKIAPYVRATAGIGFLANSYVRTDGSIQAPGACSDTGGVCQWPLVEAEHTAETTWMSSLAVGAALTFGAAYRFRFEVRDLITALQVPTGPANPVNGLAPVGTSVRHIPVFTFGLDVVLERRRGRRY